MQKRKTVISMMLAAMMFTGVAAPAHAELEASVQSTVDIYKKKLVEWAANPVIVAAVKDSNAKGGLVSDMNNAKWDELPDTSPVVTSFQTSPAGKKLAEWETDKVLNKIFARDAKGNLVASSKSKPLLFNVATKAPFMEGMKGHAWNIGVAKPDPTTQIKSVQISAPVMDNGKPIGVLHSAVTVK